MAQRVNVKGLGELEFPDGMTRDQMAAAIQQRVAQLAANAAGMVGDVVRQVGQQVGPEGIGGANEVKRIFSAVNEDYIAPTLGAPVDAVNWGLNQVGLGSENPVMGSDWLRGQLQAVGASGGPGYRPQTELGRYAAAGLGGAGAGAAGGAVIGAGLMGAGAALPGTLGQATAQAGRATITPGLDAIAGAGAGLGGQLAREEAPGNTTAELLGTFAGAVIPAGAAGWATAARNRTIDAADRIGVQPTMGTTGGKTSGYLQNNTLAQSALAADVVADASKRTQDELQGAISQIAGKYGSASPSTYATGAGVQKSLVDWFDQVKSGAGKVYDDIGKRFAPNEKFAAVKTLDALQNPVGKLDSAALAKEIGDPKIKRFLTALQGDGGELSYNDLKRFRSYVGGLLDPRSMTDIDNAQLKALYGALSDDMAAAVATKGPDVIRQWKNVNALYKNALDKFGTQFEKLVGKRAPVPPEQAYRILKGSAEVGGRENFDRFREIWSVLSPEQRGDYAATILMRMGSKSEDAIGDAADFSVMKFLSDYDKLSPQAKALIFRSTGNKEVEAALDDLLTVVKSIEQNAGKTFSTSRSGAGALQTGQIFGSGALMASGDVTGSIGLLVGPWAAAKIMTSPSATRKLAVVLRAWNAGRIDAAKVTAVLQAFAEPPERGPNSQAGESATR